MAVMVPRRRAGAWEMAMGAINATAVSKAIKSASRVFQAEVRIISVRFINRFSSVRIEAITGAYVIPSSVDEALRQKVEPERRYNSDSGKMLKWIDKAIFFYSLKSADS
jgi:hypothetical protein